MRCIGAVTLLLLCCGIKKAPAFVKPEQAKVSTVYNDVQNSTVVSIPEVDFATDSLRYFYRASYTHPGKKAAPPSPGSILFSMSEAHTEKSAWEEIKSVFFKFGTQRRNYPVTRYEVKSSVGGVTDAYLEKVYIRIPVGDYQAITSAKSFICQIAGKNYVFAGKYTTPLRSLASTIISPKKR